MRPYEQKLADWHRLNTELQEARQQAEAAAGANAPPAVRKQLQERVDRLEQAVATSLQELDKAVAAHSARSRYWASGKPSNTPDSEGRSG
jgi:CHASE3 domain sensor protein